MANLPELNEWPEGVYQLETSDPVLGGLEGIDNLQAKQLASRTKWLRAQLKDIFDGIASVGKATQLVTARALRFKGAATGSGDFDGSADTEITLTLVNSGVVAGSYPKVTVNSKGLVTGGASLAAGDLPDGITAPQFDSDKSLATTEFVQREKGGFSGGRDENGTGFTLPISDVGQFVVLASGVTQTVALPLLSSVPVGATITLHNPTTVDKVITINGGDRFSPDGTMYTVITLKQGDTVSVTKESGVWRLHGVGAVKYLAQFASVLGAMAASQKLPGLSIKVGSINSSSTASTIPLTFPVSFPTACVALVLTGWNAMNSPYTHMGRDMSGATLIKGANPSYQLDYVALGY